MPGHDFPMRGLSRPFMKAGNKGGGPGAAMFFRRQAPLLPEEVQTVRIPRRLHAAEGFRFSGRREPSVHGMRAQWSLNDASKQQTAAQHAQPDGGSREEASEVAGQGGFRRKFRKPGQLREDQKIRQGSRDIFGGGEGGRLRERLNG